MQCIRIWCRKHDLSVTRDVDGATDARPVGDVHPAYFNIVFR